MNNGAIMESTSTFEMIRRRTAELEALIKASQTELEELRVTLRVLERLTPTRNAKGEDHGQRPAIATRSGGATIADMAVAAIEQHGPVDTIELLQLLQNSWRADLQQSTLSSTLSRIKSAGLINRVDGKWQSIRMRGALHVEPENESSGAGTPDDPGS
jgi:DNA-binding transcriptional ArsR family regulator